MICIEELMSTVKRLELLKENIDSPEEKVATDLMISNLSNLIAQFNAFIKSPDFNDMVKNYGLEQHT